MSTITLKLSANSVQLIGIATFNNHNIKYNIQVILPLIRSCMSSTLFSSGVQSGGLGGPFAPPLNNFLMGGGGKQYFILLSYKSILMNMNNAIRKVAINVMLYILDKGIEGILHGRGRA